MDAHDEMRATLTGADASPLRPSIEAALDSVDAIIFTGDGVFSDDEIIRFRWYMDRWDRELKDRTGRHERRVVGHASGWKEQMDTCACGRKWPCELARAAVSAPV